jgi:D-alanine-D-alanine ligase
MKPNMTGASRPHRMDQDSLSALAARAIGWDFGSLLTNMLAQKWS